MQSTNEELETSKEELQSVNEELITVNSELQRKIEQLASMQNDMKNLLDNINIGIVFLDPVSYTHLDVYKRQAEDRQESAVGVILSGTGTDGTLGLRAILGAGGLTLVQDPATAKYDGMPSSAVQA